MSLQVLVPPVQDPVSLAETKLFLQLDADNEDALVLDLIRTATELVERRTGKSLISRTLRQSVFEWPKNGVFSLQSRPMVQVLQIQHVNDQNEVTLVDPGEYYTDVGQARIIALPTFPQIGAGQPTRKLQIDFVAGYGLDNSQIPAPLRMALLIIIKDIFEREPGVETPMPLRAQALLATFTQVRL